MTPRRSSVIANECNETKMMQYISLSIAGVFLLLQFQGYSTATLKGDGEHFSLGGGCPQGWITYKGSCYKSFEQRKTWDEAQKTCQGYGAILATIPDSGVNNALAGLLPHLHLYVDKQAWVGLNDRDTEGTYIWLGTNREATWTNWDDGEPNNSVSGNEDCVALLPDGYWNDAPCSTLLKFICEKSV
ncbi:C-type lectin-like isoform X2 [Littorina saxatilis]|uniref:C-type lectin-like isoform X2 n=1 Tax=Littorina saxatilis TaxID=31220 RepID=UPI0038B58774